MIRRLRIPVTAALLAAGFLLTPAISAQTGGQRAPAVDAAAIAGKWTLTVDSPHGKMDLSLEMRLEDGKVAGTLASEMTDTRTLSGTFAEGTLKFTTAGEENTLTFTGKFKDRDTISGYISGHTGDMIGVATRVKS